MTGERPEEQVAASLEPEETVDGVPVLVAEVRALEPARRQLPTVQVAVGVAATSFVAGAATVVAIRRQVKRRQPSRLVRKRGAAGETLSVVGTRSFLLDLHLLGRAE